MNKHPDNFRSHAHAGFSLIDLLVGMVIALLGVIIIFQVFSVSEGIKRTTTGGSDAQVNGSLAMFALERSLKGAGYGIFSSTNAYLNPPLPADPAGTAPLAISAGGTATACALPGPATANIPDCLVLTYRPSGGANSWDFGSFPPASGVGFTTPPALTVETITVQTNCNGNGSPLLQLCSSLTGVIADGIVLVKAEYGIDTNNDGIVDTWTQTPRAKVLTVLAVGLDLISRRAQPEVTKTAAGIITTCATTTVAPIWIDNNNVALDLTNQADLKATGDDWRCYRYKTFENTVPLRNVIWRP